MRFTYLIGFGALAMLAQAAAAGPISSQTPPRIGGVDIVPVHNTCHSNVRTHGGSYPEHYHDQQTCGMMVVMDDDDDCHHNVIRHYVPGYGKTWHKHNASCQVVLYDYDQGPTTGHGGCIQVGPVTVCN